MKTSENDLNEFVQSYLVTMLWSSYDLTDNDDNCEPLDENYGIDDISDELKKESIDDCKDFLTQADDMIDDYGSAGHDFWLTRNGHGAGFWDGDYPEHGDKLTEISKIYGGSDPYSGDDGKIYA